jgi:Ca2+:H+ antiporter
LDRRIRYFIEDYWDIFIGVVSIALAFIFNSQNESSLSTLFAAIGIAALSLTVAEVADILSERLHEPYGSFVLTFSAVAVEIILLYVILLEVRHSPEVLETVKGGIISAVIVDLNVLLGLSVFLGGLAFSQQQHNKETSSAYTTVLFVASSALLVPGLLSHTDHGIDSLTHVSHLIAGVLLLFYIIIFIFQTRTHTHFFKATARSRFFRLKRKLQEEEDAEIDENDSSDYIFEHLSTPINFIAIFGFIAIIAFGAEIFAGNGVMIAREHGISAGLAGLVIAIISVSPEIFTAVRAARNDQIQRVVNIAMGASTVSIILTVPILMMLAYFSGINLTLDFNPLQIGALLLTILLVWKTTDEGETNYFEGASHMMFFLSYAIIAAYY